MHVVNSATFRRVTGTEPPACPLTAAQYAAADLPFFSLYDEKAEEDEVEPVATLSSSLSSFSFSSSSSWWSWSLDTPVSGVSGQAAFAALRSVNAIDRQRGLATCPESLLRFRTEALHAGPSTPWWDREVFAVKDADCLVSPNGPLRPQRTLEHLRDALD